MKKTGLVRGIDYLGRIVIPKDLRKELFGSVENAEFKQMEFYIDDGKIILIPTKDNY